jgi:hypothetical protein
MKWLVNETVKQYLRLRMKRIERYMRRPEAAQERWFSKLLDSARHTEFGRKHHFSAIRSPEDFARQVPVHDYDSIKGDIARMMRGERMCFGPARSTGTAKAAALPATKASLSPCPDDQPGTLPYRRQLGFASPALPQQTRPGDVPPPQPAHAR